MSRPQAIQWTMDPNDLVFQQCAPVNLSFSGGQPPYNIQAQTWYMSEDYATGTQTNMTNAYTLKTDWAQHAVQWPAAEYPNTTVTFNVSDTYNDWALQTVFIVNSNPLPGDTPWCLEPGTTYTPTAGLAGVTRWASSSSSSYSSSSSSHGGRATVTETQWAGGYYWDTDSNIKKATIGLGVLTALLFTALLGVLLVNYRLRKQLKRMQTSQSTVGNWMNHHRKGTGGNGSTNGNGNGNGNGNSNRDSASSAAYEKVPSLPQKAALQSKSLSSPDEHTRFSSGSSTKYSFLSRYTDRSSGLSSFFQKRSVSRGVSAVSPYHNTTTNVNRNGDGNGGSRTRLVSNPVTLEGLNEVLRIDTRGSFDSRRTSAAETMCTDNTETSNALSSVAPSEQATSVAGYSTVSDEHYHRRKAFTISPTTPSTSAIKSPFLDPDSASVAGRRLE